MQQDLENTVMGEETKAGCRMVGMETFFFKASNPKQYIFYRYVYKHSICYICRYGRGVLEGHTEHAQLKEL